MFVSKTQHSWSILREIPAENVQISFNKNDKNENGLTEQLLFNTGNKSQQQLWFWIEIESIDHQTVPQVLNDEILIVVMMPLLNLY